LCTVCTWPIHNPADWTFTVSPVDLFSANAALINAVLNASCRVHRLAPDHADEFRSWATVRLLDHEQAILRKFSARSSLRTFLVTVVERLFLDWRNHEWGKWRPSSEARRHGAVAIELERLILRDHYTFDEAVRTLIGRGLAASAAECEGTWARLPRRPRRQRVDEESLSELPADLITADRLEANERCARVAAVQQALERAIAGLPADDQAILRLRYWSGVTVARIAVMTGQDQKQLYRRFERLSRGLKQRLEEQGVSAADLAGSLDGLEPADMADGVAR
jgi:RNA polymerase sigma factor (sigma-70 family)